MRSDPKRHREAWQVLIALGQHARDGELEVIADDPLAATFHISEISLLYPLIKPGKSGQVELICGDLFPAQVDITKFHDALRRKYPRKKSAGRSLAHPDYFQAAVRYWAANAGKPPPGQVRKQIELTNQGIEKDIPPATIYRYIENARKLVRKID
ncbi:MAG: hypothetical protein AAGH53_13865 [Pseudomonadota bacterium]